MREDRECVRRTEENNREIKMRDYDREMKDREGETDDIERVNGGKDEKERE